ncbi:MAG: DUF721 domain-containing protein [Alphaproteobacteria bacterium]
MPSDTTPSRTKKRGGTRRLGDLARPLLTPAFRRQGFAQQEIVTRWREIVGPLLGKRSVPERLNFPRSQRRGGTLSVLVESAFALEFQHLTPQVLDRVNTYYGYAAVEKLVIRQGPLPRERRTAAKPETELSEKAAAELQADLADMKPGPARDSLARLGKRLLADAEKQGS